MSLKRLVTQWSWWLGAMILAMVIVLLWAIRNAAMPTRHAVDVTRREVRQSIDFETPFQNARLDVEYVGSQTCLKCHAQHEDAFHQPIDRRSLEEIDLSKQPADQALDRPAERRRFEVERADGVMWHRELALLPNEKSDQSSGTEILRELPIKYVLGSGRRRQVYLAEQDGFLIESPIHFDVQAQQWSTEAAYEWPLPERETPVAGAECLRCHVGPLQSERRGSDRLQWRESSISCEQCHGPGQLHVEKHRSAGADAEVPQGSVIDTTIVNPRHLSRPLADAICSQCHLTGDVTVLSAHREFSDFRPGLPLQLFRQEYGLDGPSVVWNGHAVPLWASRCAQSQELTCTTCHPPHGAPKAEDKHAFFRERCVKCHAVEDCGPATAIEADGRTSQCVKCHMPTQPRSLAHQARTRHHITLPTINVPALVPTYEVKQDLHPILDPSLLDEAEQMRSLGLAYFELTHRTRHEILLEHQKSALTYLQQARRRGLTDDANILAMAQLRGGMGISDPLPTAQSALREGTESLAQRCEALSLVAQRLAKYRQHKDALILARELVRHRRDTRDWLLIAESELSLGAADRAKAALDTAVGLQHLSREQHARIATLYEQLKLPEQSRLHRRLSESAEIVGPDDITGTTKSHSEPSLPRTAD